ncbi:MAG: hypothetical protein IAE93_12990 [Ignavibacteria bacterium]|nr:hypothetical protein [Ignavibacteria bacterium]
MNKREEVKEQKGLLNAKDLWIYTLFSEQQAEKLLVLFGERKEAEKVVYSVKLYNDENMERYKKFRRELLEMELRFLDTELKRLSE